MNNNDLSKKILEFIGGNSNIKNVFNCYTRVRAEVKDLNLVKQDELKNLAGVIGVVIAGNQVQIIVGPGKSVKVANEINNLIANDKNEITSISEDEQKKKDKEEFKKEYLETKAKTRNKAKGSVIFKKIAGIFVPIIPAFIACGLLLAILEIIKTQISGFEDTTVGTILNIISTSVFSILSVIVGYNACKEFGGDGILGACLAAVITNPLLGTIDNPFLTLGSLKLYAGLGGVISVILVAISTAYFEKLLRKFMPNAIDAFVTPLISLAVMSLAGLFVFMPIGGYVSLGIQKLIEAILGAAPFLLGIVPGFYLLMVLFGVHHVLIPISQTLIDSTTTTTLPGYSILVPVQLMAGAAEIGAAIYFLITSKNKKMKMTVLESIPIGVLGIDEPLIWGMTFPLKRLFIPIGIAGAISGGVLSVVLNNLQAGSLVPESTGIEASLVMSNTTAKWVFAVVFVGAIILGFITTALVGYKEIYEVKDEATGQMVEKENETSLFLKWYRKSMFFKKFSAKKAKKAEIENSAIICAPCKGEVIAIESLKDKTFADKIMGDGVAIIPSEGKLFAPFDGTISALMDTKHAYGLTSKDGCEILIHIGQDTVNLKGQYFDTKLKTGDEVKKGDLLCTFDIKKISEAGYDIKTPIIVMNDQSWTIKEKCPNNIINVGDTLIKIAK